MTNLIIEIFKEDEQPILRQVTSKKDGSIMTFSEQNAYLHNGGKFPVRTRISLEKGQSGYQAGRYTLHPNSFLLDNYGNVTLARRLILVPLEGK